MNRFLIIQKKFAHTKFAIIASRTTRAISLRSERSMSRGFPSLELDTVMEERSDDPEQTQVTKRFIELGAVNMNFKKKNFTFRLI